MDAGRFRARFHRARYSPARDGTFPAWPAKWKPRTRAHHGRPDDDQSSAARPDSIWVPRREADLWLWTRPGRSYADGSRSGRDALRQWGILERRRIGHAALGRSTIRAGGHRLLPARSLL